MMGHMVARVGEALFAGCLQIKENSRLSDGEKPSGAVAPDERLLHLKDNYNNAKWRDHLSTMIVNDV